MEIAFVFAEAGACIVVKIVGVLMILLVGAMSVIFLVLFMIGSALHRVLSSSFGQSGGVLSLVFGGLAWLALSGCALEPSPPPIAAPVRHSAPARDANVSAIGSSLNQSHW